MSFLSFFLNGNLVAVFFRIDFKSYCGLFLLFWNTSLGTSDVVLYLVSRIQANLTKLLAGRIAAQKMAHEAQRLFWPSKTLARDVKSFRKHKILRINECFSLQV